MHFPDASGAKLGRALESVGWQRMRQRGSHVRLKHPERRNPLVVPLHRELKRGTLSAILKDAGLSADWLRGTPLISGANRCARRMHKCRFAGTNGESGAVSKTATCQRTRRPFLGPLLAASLADGPRALARSALTVGIAGATPRSSGERDSDAANRNHHSDSLAQQWPKRPRSRRA
jgi:predicted RNA binding protein YcfA (HicA-like mRNA interferase family)